MCVLAKVGEASLKGRNKRHFLDTLRRNLKAALAGVDARVQGGGSVLAIAVPDELVADEVASRLERVFGFAVASVCLRCERSVERIADVAMSPSRACSLRPSRCVCGGATSPSR